MKRKDAFPVNLKGIFQTDNTRGPKELRQSVRITAAALLQIFALVERKN